MSILSIVCFRHSRHSRRRDSQPLSLTLLLPVAQVSRLTSADWDNTQCVRAPAVPCVLPYLVPEADELYGSGALSRKIAPLSLTLSAITPSPNHRHVSLGPG